MKPERIETLRVDRAVADAAPQPTPPRAPAQTPAPRSVETARGAARTIQGTGPTGPASGAGLAPTGKIGATAPQQPVSRLRKVFEELSVPGGPVQARLLEDNLEAWNARWQMMASATKKIDSYYFIVEKDVYGFAFLGHLLHKQRNGVKVRLGTDAMADTVGTHGFKMKLRGQDYLQELVGAGADVGVFHPIYMRFLRPQGLLGLEFMSSNHDKILVVDGKRSMTGGRNIGREYFIDPKDMEEAWRDTDVQLEGRGAAVGLTQAFDREFHHWSVDDVSADWYNFSKKDAELLGAYLMMDHWLSAPPLAEANKKALKDDPMARQRLVGELMQHALAKLPAEGITRSLSDGEMERLRKHAEELVGYPEARGSAHAYDAKSELHSGEVRILDQTSSVSNRINDFAPALVELVRAAEHRIVIENPYVVLTEDMTQALEEAASRGVEIIIGTNSPLSTDSATTQSFFLDDWPYILARVPTARLFVATGKRKLHAKTAVIDDHVTIVSTYNMDFLSGYVNSEVGALIWSDTFKKETYDSFMRDFEDPKNGVLEYKIKRDAEGRAILDDDGKPIVEFGHNEHLTQEILDDYEGRRWRVRQLRKLPYFRPLQYPDLVPKK